MQIFFIFKNLLCFSRQNWKYLLVTCDALKNDYFRTISSHFFADCIYNFHKNYVQMVILRCLICQKPDCIKSYKKKHNKNNFPFLQFCKKKPENLRLKNGHFTTLSGHFSANYIKIFQKNEIQTVILRCLVGLNLNWIKSYGMILVKTIFFMPHFRAGLSAKSL